MKRNYLMFLVVLLLLGNSSFLLSGCGSGGGNNDEDADADADSDGDTDTDADGDTDTDADGDTDTDADTDTDTDTDTDADADVQECVDEDGDNYGENCQAGEDCDDTSAQCTTECVDTDNDNTFDCKDDCLDVDGDNYGEGRGCTDEDCDDNAALCNVDCTTDANQNNHRDCDENCDDNDGDGYGTGDDCIDTDCDDNSISCNTDCTTDDNGNDVRDCDENCVDEDRDGYGEGDDCIDADCDDNSELCTTVCEDVDNDGINDCMDTCIDIDGDGYGTGDDCTDEDCSDIDLNNWISCNTCMDADLDGYYANCDSYVTITGPDCYDDSMLCTEECLDTDNDNVYDCMDDCIDPDGDLYGTGDGCFGDDCDETNSFINTGAREICGNGIDEDCIDGDQECGECTFTRVDQDLNIITTGYGNEGATFNDFDNDGDLDLIVTHNNGTGHDLLFRNDGDTFTEIGNDVGITDAASSTGVSMGDYDNDGYLDIYIGNSGQDFLYDFDGSSYTRVDAALGINESLLTWGGVSFVDYNNDGFFDIFATGRSSNNQLYQFNGTIFSNEATTAGVAGPQDGVGNAFADYDNDGDQDLFIANLSGQNSLYQNNGNGTFSKVDTSVGIVDNSSSGSGSWGDYDNDGDLDLFVANYQNQQDLLYQNNGDGTFSEIAQSVGISDLTSGIGVSFGDYDSDGDLDIFVANYSGAQGQLLYRNDGGTFTNVAADLGITESSSSMATVFADYDNDGDLDIFEANWNAQSFLWRNDCPSRSYIVLRPVIANANDTYRDAIGARVYVDIDGNGDFAFPGTIMQEVSGGNSWASQPPLWLTFGLGDILHDVAVRVVFPGPGTMEERTVTYNHVNINQRNFLYQDGTTESF